MTLLPSSEAVLENLCAQHQDPRRQRSLKIIDAVCRGQSAHGSTDYSTNVIGRLSKAQGGPGAGAIRNPSGAPFRELIDSHKRNRAPAPSAKGGKELDDEATLLAGIRSPLQRARISFICAEARRLEAEVRQWRIKANSLQAVADAASSLTLEARGADYEAKLGHHGKLGLLPIERDALATALRPSRLAAAGLRTDARGRIMLANGKAVFPIGFATLLAKVAAAVGIGQIEGTHVGDVTD